MKRNIIVLSFLVFPFLLFSQEKLSKLKAPTSPAASVLGLQPSVVLAPKSYEALETALFTNFVEEGSVIIPNDLSVEFTPYWAKDHSLSLDEYLFPESFGDQLWRGSSFSIASSQNFLLEDSTKSNGLSFGYRTTFYFGTKNWKESVVGKVKALNASQAVVAGIFSELILLYPKYADRIKLLNAIEPIMLIKINEVGAYENPSKVVVEIVAEMKKSEVVYDQNNPDDFEKEFLIVLDKHLKSEEVFEAVKEDILNRKGWSVDFAYAGVLNFPSNDMGFSYVPKQAFWLSPTYDFSNKWSFLKLVGVLRYEWYNQGYYKRYFPSKDIYEKNFDYGFSINTEFERFSINIEFVGRSSSSEILAGMDSEGNQLYRMDQQSDNQILGTFNYNLTDQLVLSYSLGNKFVGIIYPDDTLVSLLTLNFGFGAPTEKDLDLIKN
ncbi:hypothetical protein Oweho_0004 [Owenweeksia hongkongensis DSM 17368]|uniref:Uncharacterized protein n=1 Tax=Owenweeksia hongkongensis (strain DSM 17368 / CIP 108786 / JCM 12287 / NRRL B-23963 / UST20020801) TaxID=926562 RepID=G8R520_OWEHD|nr:hypothetical protein [Owenweeksia hongkongensis]AEV31031.1 hypothetical protein Oweho_0004 [Owenweeksia hongkongensis DSM 17368]